MKDLKHILIEALNESILDLRDMDDRIEKDEKAVGLKAVLQSYSNINYLREYRYEGDTLKLNYGADGFMKDFQNMADELGCKSFKINYNLIIQGTPSLKDLYIESTGQFQIDCPCKIENCTIRNHGTNLGLVADKQGNLVVKNSTVDSFKMAIRGLNKFNFQGSEFRADRLALTEIGPNIRKVVESWGICDIKNNRFKKSSSEFNTSIEPIKDLGLDKYFKNIDTLYIALGTSREDICICCELTPSHDLQDWGVLRYGELDNGWTICLIDNIDEVRDCIPKYRPNKIYGV